MSKRIALTLTLFALASGAFAQGPGDLSYHKTVAGPTEFIQRTVVLPVPAPPPGSTTGAPLVTAPVVVQPAVANQLAVEAALLWMVRHGYLLDDAGTPAYDVSISGNGITLTINVPGGGDIVIILSNGPFLPMDIPHRLMTVTVARPIQLQISNGF